MDISRELTFKVLLLLLPNVSVSFIHIISRIYGINGSAFQAAINRLSLVFAALSDTIFSTFIHHS